MRELRSRPRGATSLVVVMVLFFLMMLAAIFNSRSLIFEQKTSANQYRYTQAFEAGEAGMQWALTLLNGGRVDASCNPTADTAHATFRERYLRTDIGTGQLQLQVADVSPGVPGVTAGCVMTDAGWSCSCPTAGNAALAQPAGVLNRPAFTVQFIAAAQPGLVHVKARGCSSFGSQCAAAAAERSDAYVELDSLLALAGGLRTPPSAMLTAHGDVSFAGTDMRFTNTDEETQGITINAGGTIASGAHLTSTPGSVASQSTVANDTSLSTLCAVTPHPACTQLGKTFVTFFGIDKDAFHRLSSVRRVTCGAECSSEIQAAYDAGYRMIWVDGDLAIDSSTTLGTRNDPLLLATDGNVQLGGTARVYGVVYSGAELWNNGPGSAVLHGAAVAEGDFRGAGSTHFVYDPDVLAQLHFRTGTFARVPGSWSDTRP